MEQKVDARVGQPAPGLRGRVGYHGYDLSGLRAGRHRGLPSPFLTLIVSFGEPLTMRRSDGGLEHHDVVVGGLHTEPVEIVHDGNESGIHVTLHPLAARQLLGMPTAALDVDVHGEAVLGAAARELHDRVGEAHDWAGRFAALDAVLARRLGVDVPAESPELRRAWHTLVGDPPASVRSVADDVGWSDRHLGARFRAEFGLTPKVAARVARFDRARREIAGRDRSDGPLGLADVAADHGYADQAHLTREFRALAGLAPTQWLAEERWLTEEVGNLQDAPPPEHAA